ncbi:uncharacterized protein LOC108676322 [Hyalella azteca]|uniref:Uncharacterized protein LOC108676322 n=1 Tax=Hyalella azteca TaxID=294128 RepID=A0A8B7P1N5_HYAAZ|nr:uncharacterized protein LOC108676322 [Hyalella azteca]
MWTRHGGGGTMQSGRGQYLYDDSGAQYIDCINSTAQVGHCNTRVVAASCQRLEDLLPDSGHAGANCDLETLLRRTLPPHLDSFLFCDSGTAAVDLSIRLARLWCGRNSSKLGCPSNSFKKLKKSHAEVSDGLLNAGPSSATVDADIGKNVEEETALSSSKRSGNLTSRIFTHCTESEERSASGSSISKSLTSHFTPSASLSFCPLTTDSKELSSCSHQIATLKGRRSHEDNHAQKFTCDFPEKPSEFCAAVGQNYDFGADDRSHRTPSHEQLPDVRASTAARRRRARGDVVVVEGSFHGCTDSVVRLSSRIKPTRSFRRSSYTVHVVPVADTYRASGLGDAAASSRPSDAVESIVLRYLADSRRILEQSLGDGGQVACLLVEPLLTIQGGLHPPASWLQGLYSLVREFGGLCISDEVQSGLGRLGDAMWGFECQGVSPDIVVIAKGLGNGWPMAVAATSSQIAAMLGPLRSAHQCSAVQNAVGAAVLRTLVDERLMQNAASTGRSLQLLLRKLQDKHPYVGDVRGQGLLQAVDVVWNAEQRVPSAQIADFLVHKLRRVGTVIAREGIHKNVLLIMPPMTFDILDAAALVTKLDEALALVPHTFGITGPTFPKTRTLLTTQSRECFLSVGDSTESLSGATLADVRFESHSATSSLGSRLRDVRGPHRLEDDHRQSDIHPRNLLHLPTEPSAQQDILSESRDTLSNPETSSVVDVRSFEDQTALTVSSRPTVRKRWREATSFHQSRHPSSCGIRCLPQHSSDDADDIAETSLSVDPSPRDAARQQRSLPSVPGQTSSNSLSVSFTSPMTRVRSADVFSNIIMVEREASPHIAVETASPAMLDARLGVLDTRRASSATAPTRRGKGEELHPNELPRNCGVLGIGLGLRQPLPARPSAPSSPRVPHEDVD